MTPIQAELALAALLLVVLGFFVFSLLQERKTNMSEIEKLSADVDAAVAKISALEAANADLVTANQAKDAQIADLTTQLAAAQAAQGASDAALVPLETKLENAVNPPAPAPPPATDPNAPPAA